MAELRDTLGWDHLVNSFVILQIFGVNYRKYVSNFVCFSTYFWKTPEKITQIKVLALDVRLRMWFIPWCRHSLRGEQYFEMVTSVFSEVGFLHNHKKTKTGSNPMAVPMIVHVAPPTPVAAANQVPLARNFLPLERNQSLPQRVTLWKLCELVYLLCEIYLKRRFFFCCFAILRRLVKEI